MKYGRILLVVDLPILIAVVITFLLKQLMSDPDLFESGAISFQFISGSIAAYVIDRMSSNQPVSPAPTGPKSAGKRDNFDAHRHSLARRSLGLVTRVGSRDETRPKIVQNVLSPARPFIFTPQNLDRPAYGTR